MQRRTKETSMVWLKFFPYVESIANLMPVVMLAVGGVFLIRGELTMGDYVAFSGLIWAIANPMRQMGNIMNEFQRFSAASKKGDGDLLFRTTDQRCFGCSCTPGPL